jgi:hypothetical protein
VTRLLINMGFQEKMVRTVDEDSAETPVLQSRL